MAHQVVGGDVDILEEEVQASHLCHAIERGGEVAGLDVVFVEYHPSGVAHIEDISRPVDGDDEGEHARDRQEHLVDEAEAPLVGDRHVLQILTLGIDIEPVLDTGDAQNTGELHHPPDDNLYGEQRETYPRAEGTGAEYRQGYPGVYHIIARHLLVVSCDDIPLPQ